MESEPLLDSLRSAVTAMPDDVPLRLHLAALLLRAGQRDEAVRHLGAVLQRDPGNGEALALLTGQHPSAPADPSVSPERTVAPAGDSASSPAVADPADDGDAPALPTAPTAPPAPAAPPGAPGGWRGRGHGQLRLVAGRGRAARRAARHVRRRRRVHLGRLDEARAYDAEHAGLTLADVAGLDRGQEAA